MDLIPQKCVNWRRNGNTEGGLDCEQEFEQEYEEFEQELDD